MVTGSLSGNEKNSRETKGNDGKDINKIIEFHI